MSSTALNCIPAILPLNINVDDYSCNPRPFYRIKLYILINTTPLFPQKFASARKCRRFIKKELSKLAIKNPPTGGGDTYLNLDNLVNIKGSIGTLFGTTYENFEKFHDSVNEPRESELSWEEVALYAVGALVIVAAVAFIAPAFTALVPLATASNVFFGAAVAAGFAMAANIIKQGYSDSAFNYKDLALAASSGAMCGAFALLSTSVYMQMALNAGVGIAQGRLSGSGWFDAVVYDGGLSALAGGVGGPGFSGLQKNLGTKLTQSAMPSRVRLLNYEPPNEIIFDATIKGNSAAAAVGSIPSAKKVVNDISDFTANNAKYAYNQISNEVSYAGDKLSEFGNYIYDHCIASDDEYSEGAEQKKRLLKALGLD